MSFDMAGWLDDDSWLITGVASTAHPDGGSYSIACPSMRDTSLLRAITGGDGSAESAADVMRHMCEYLEVDDLSKVDSLTEAMHRKLLGPVFDQLVDDGVSSVRVERVYQAALLRFTQNEETVRRVVEAEGKALAAQVPANRAGRRAAAKKSSPRTPQKQAGSNSNQASSATPARTRSRASSPSSKTPAAKAAAARKAS